MSNFNSIGSGVSEPQVAENRYLPLTGGIALTTVYTLTWYTVRRHKKKKKKKSPINTLLVLPTYIANNCWGL